MNGVAHSFRTLLDFVLEIYYYLMEFGYTTFVTLTFNLNDLRAIVNLPPVNDDIMYTSPLLGSLFVYGLGFFLMWSIIKWFLDIIPGW